MHIRRLLLISIAIFLTAPTSHATSPIPKTDKTIVYCPQKTRAYGAKLTQDSSSGRLIEVQFYCKTISDGTASNAKVIKSHTVPRAQECGGSKESIEIFCPSNGFIIGYQVDRNEQGINDMRLYCSNHAFTDSAENPRKGRGWKYLPNSNWRKVLRCPFGKVSCGVRTHVTKIDECNGDTDQLRIACCTRL